MSVPARVFVVGGGRVGTALLQALRAAGVDCGSWARREGPPPVAVGAAEVVILAVPDGAIGEVGRHLFDAGRLASPQVVLHCAGAWAADEVLAPLAGRVRGRGTLHPLCAFAGTPLVDLRGVGFGIEGDEAGRDAARRLCAILGGLPVEVPEGRLPLYHAAAVTASNYVAVLFDAAVTLLGRAAPEADGLGALLPLARSALEAVAARGLPGGLTGPIARGDAETVRRHLEALRRDAPDLGALYRTLGLEAAALAARQGEADPPGLAAVRRLLQG